MKKFSIIIESILFATLFMYNYFTDRDGLYNHQHQHHLEKEHEKN